MVEERIRRPVHNAHDEHPVRGVDPLVAEGDRSPPEVFDERAFDHDVLEELCRQALSELRLPRVLGIHRLEDVDILLASFVVGAYSFQERCKSLLEIVALDEVRLSGRAEARERGNTSRRCALGNSAEKLHCIVGRTCRDEQLCQLDDRLGVSRIELKGCSQRCLVAELG